MNSKASPAAIEICDACGAGIAAAHQHLIDPATRKLECVCDSCAILFASNGITRYRRVPRRIQYLPDVRIDDPQWNSLMIPIDMAFLFYSSSTGKVLALYPSPGGAVEASLPFDSWKRIVEANPVLEEMQPDVEGLLVYRIGSNRDHFLIPIDECFKLVGLIRTRWKGFSGGTDLWNQVDEFINRLKQ